MFVILKKNRFKVSAQKIHKMKNLIISTLILTILSSFTLHDNPKIEIVKSNIKLENSQFELKDGIYLLNRSEFENFYVDVTSNRVFGKEYNFKTHKKKKITGTRFNLKFYEKCNLKGIKLKKEKTFVTVWDGGRFSAWNTECELIIDDYKIEIKAIY